MNLQKNMMKKVLIFDDKEEDATYNLHTFTQQHPKLSNSDSIIFHHDPREIIANWLENKFQINQYACIFIHSTLLQNLQRSSEKFDEIFDELERNRPTVIFSGELKGGIKKNNIFEIEREHLYQNLNDILKFYLDYNQLPLNVLVDHTLKIYYQKNIEIYNYIENLSLNDIFNDSNRKIDDYLKEFEYSNINTFKKNYSNFNKQEILSEIKKWRTK